MSAIPRSPRIVLALARASLAVLALSGTSCDLAKPTRSFNHAARQPLIRTIDASALRPGQHLIGTITLRVGSLGPPTSSQVLMAKLYVDSTHVADAYSPTLQFQLDTHVAPDGPHLVSVLVYEGNPNTGLLRFTDAPSQILSTWVVFDHSPPTPVRLESVVWEGDQPRLTWTANHDSNFAAYQVIRSSNAGITASNLEPITDQATLTCLDDAGLIELIGTRLIYRVAVSNGEALSAPSDSLELASVGEVVPGLIFRGGDRQPISSRIREEFYAWNAAHDSLIAWSVYTRRPLRGFQPGSGSTVALSLDGNTFIVQSDPLRTGNDVLRTGSPVLATYSVATFAPLSSLALGQSFAGYAMVAGRADRVYMVGPDGVYALRVSDGAVLDHAALALTRPHPAASPDGRSLFIAAGDSLFKMDISTDALGVSVRTGIENEASDLQVGWDGRRLYLGNTLTGPSFLEVYDAGTLGRVGVVFPPGLAQLYAFRVSARHLYASYAMQGPPGSKYVQGGVSQIDLTGLTGLRWWGFVQVPQGLVASRDSGMLFASAFETWWISTTSPRPKLARR